MKPEHPLLFEPFGVLDDGCISLTDFMGSDKQIVNLARASYGNDAKTLEEMRKPMTEKDIRLLRRLMRDNHSSPFEGVELLFFVRLPIYVARQWMRHRTFSYNEYSGRYKPMIDRMHETEPTQWRLQSEDNKQGSYGYFPFDDGFSFSEEEDHLFESARKLYLRLLDKGVSKEQARKLIPVANYTEFYCKGNLRNFFHFLKLRMAKDAQEEIRAYANTMARIIKEIVPHAYEAFEDYSLHAVTFSRMEMEMLHQMVINGVNESTVGFVKHPKMTDSEWLSFLQKIAPGRNK